jgi:hypothetical protein
MIPEQRILWDMTAHCAAWRQVLERYHPQLPTRQKDSIMEAYFEGVLAPEETGALMNTLKLKEA